MAGNTGFMPHSDHACPSINLAATMRATQKAARAQLCCAGMPFSERVGSLLREIRRVHRIPEAGPGEFGSCCGRDRAADKTARHVQISVSALLSDGTNAVSSSIEQLYNPNARQSR